MSRQPKSDNIHPRPRLARSHDSWRNWWFGYVSQPDPSSPGESRYNRLDVLFPKYAPFASAAAAGENLRELFVRSAELVPRYGANAVAEGLWKVAQPLTVSYADSLWDADTDDETAERAMSAMPRLFRDLFAVHCDRAMCSGGSTTDNKLNSPCYMWFDLIGLDHVELRGIPPHRLHTAFAVLGQILTIPHVACQESALHGLGHIARFDRSLTASTIRRFKSRDEKLQRYAEAAAVGAVQ